MLTTLRRRALPEVPLSNLAAPFTSCPCCVNLRSNAPRDMVQSMEYVQPPHRSSCLCASCLITRQVPTSTPTRALASSPLSCAMSPPWSCPSLACVWLLSSSPVLSPGIVRALELSPHCANPACYGARSVYIVLSYPCLFLLSARYPLTKTSHYIRPHLPYHLLLPVGSQNATSKYAGSRGWLCCCLRLTSPCPLPAPPGQGGGRGCLIPDARVKPPYPSQAAAARAG